MATSDSRHVDWSAGITKILGGLTLAIPGLVVVAIVLRRVFLGYEHLHASQSMNNPFLFLFGAALSIAVLPFAIQVILNGLKVWYPEEE